MTSSIFQFVDWNEELTRDRATLAADGLPDLLLRPVAGCLLL